MELFAASFIVIALAALCMALGVIAGRRPVISGCAAHGPRSETGAACDVCGGACEADKPASRDREAV